MLAQVPHGSDGIALHGTGLTRPGGLLRLLPIPARLGDLLQNLALCLTLGSKVFERRSSRGFRRCPAVMGLLVVDQSVLLAQVPHGSDGITLDLPCLTLHHPRPRLHLALLVQELGLDFRPLFNFLVIQAFGVSAHHGFPDFLSVGLLDLRHDTSPRVFHQIVLLQSDMDDLAVHNLESPRGHGSSRHD